jgi:hypothetical protein
MENKINIAELLKDCPEGMEFDCTIFEGAKLSSISDYNGNYPIRIVTKSGIYYNLTKYGQITDNEDAKCVIFPKGKTTWEGFVPLYKFKDGDILISVHGNPFIFKEPHNDKICGCYCGIAQYGELGIESPYWTSYDNLRLATEEEKQKLFDAIRENGYKWNSETKTLEKLMEPNFKDGDILSSRYGNPFILKTHLPKSDSVSSYCALDFDDNFQEGCNRWAQASGCRLATEEEKQKLFDVIKANGLKWNEETKTLEKLIVPKFKVGDIIQNKDGYKVKITEVNIDDECYKYLSKLFKVIGAIDFKDQDEWELVFGRIKPKFKDGDRIKHKLTGEIYTVMFVLPHGGGTYEVAITNEIGKSISINEQDNYELVPDKFDITTLKPFDKVLARCSTLEKWRIQLFEKYNETGKFPFICMGYNKYNECIPYEGNEHLLDTADNCDEFYKTWEG